MTWTVHEFRGEVQLLKDHSTRAVFWGPYAVPDAERCARLLNQEEEV